MVLAQKRGAFLPSFIDMHGLRMLKRLAICFASNGCWKN